MGDSNVKHANQGLGKITGTDGESAIKGSGKS